MRCRNCGNKVTSETEICDKCGAEINHKGVKNTVFAILKIIVCILIMTLCEACVMTGYMTSSITKDDNFVIGIQSIVNDVQNGTGENGELSEEEQNRLLDKYYQIVTDTIESVQKNILEHTSAISLVGGLLTVLVLCLSLRLRRHEPLKSMRFRLCHPGRLFSFLIFGVALQYVVILIVGLIPLPENIATEFSELYSSYYTGADSKAVQIVSLGIVTPIVEEMIFRGFAVPHLKRTAGRSAAVIISAAIFSLCHYGSVISMGYAFAIGIIFALMFDKYDSVLPSILCHMGFNLANFIRFSEDGSIPLTVVVLGVALAIFFAYRIFFRYPTFSDVLFDTENMTPINETEEKIYSRIREIKESEDTPDRAEIESLNKEWTENRALASGKVKLKEEKEEKEQENTESNNSTSEE